MRSYLPFWASVAVLATTTLPAQAFKCRPPVLPVPQGMSGTVVENGCGSCGTATNDPRPPVYDPARNGHLLHRLHLHNHYAVGTYPATPHGAPPEPPMPPYPQYYVNLPLNIPRAPDLNNPGPYGVMPWFPPFQGMLLPPPRPNPGAPGMPVMGGGMAAQHPGTFGYHPFARSPRDFFMAHSCR